MFLLWGAPSQAAPALPSPICLIRGQIEGLSTRVFEYDPVLLKNSKLPVTHTYHDVSLKVLSSALAKDQQGDCKKILTHQTFQLRNKQDQLKKGQCIEAHTQFSGDEFVIGQWLFEIKQLPIADCASKKNKKN